MASKVAGDLKDLLTIKQKSRLDGTCDQYSRIFMVRLLLVSTIVMAVSWYSDKMNCIIPKTNDVAGGFVSSACWIQGVYIYDKLVNRVGTVGYFGIPKNMDHEGVIEGTNSLCSLRPKLGVRPSPKCKEMEKTFYLQYQYMPFLIGTLALLYYLPYVAFRMVNKDKQLLKNAIKKVEKSADEIVDTHFQKCQNSIMTRRVVFNIVVKVMYILSNVLTFVWLDDVLNKNFVSYGSSFVTWSRQNNTIQYNYMGMRDFPKPGNFLLPPFGYCEVYESARDVKVTLANKHKFVCEISQHILYQYCLLVLWFGIVIGFVVSSVGLLNQISIYFCYAFRCKVNFKNIHLRQLELLEYIRQRDMEFYEKCKTLLVGGKDKTDVNQSLCNSL